MPAGCVLIQLSEVKLDFVQDELLRRHLPEDRCLEQERVFRDRRHSDSVVAFHECNRNTNISFSASIPMSSTKKKQQYHVDPRSERTSCPIPMSSSRQVSAEMVRVATPRRLYFSLGLTSANCESAALSIHFRELVVYLCHWYHSWVLCVHEISFMV